MTARLCPDLGFDPSASIWSESVALFVCNGDANQFVSLRACRYPDASRAWLWVHVAEPGGSWGFNVDHLPCSPERAALRTERVAYEAGGGAGEFVRSGPPSAPSSAAVSLRVGAHPGLDVPDADGPVEVAVTATFTPTAAAGATLPGRTEVFGVADVHVAPAGAEPFTVHGVAQWHEQHQSDPRFIVPFTYATLRGADMSLVGLVGPRRSGGFARTTAGGRTFSEARFADPDGDGRHSIGFVDARDGSELRGEATVRHTIHIPIYGRRWWGTIVSATLDGAALTGSINRWRP